MGALRDKVKGRLLGFLGPKDEYIEWMCVVPIGASGATGTLAHHPNGIAVAKNTTGVYDVTGAPICPSGAGVYWFGIESAAGTVGSAYVTAKDLTAGTMTFETAVGVTATEPADGDVITIFFRGSPK